MGFLRIEKSLASLYRSILLDAAVVALLFCAAVFINFLFLSRLQRVISGPIEKLAEKMKEISEHKNYSARAEKTSDDEFGVLIDGFNEMLEKIQRRDGKLEEYRGQLEAEVRKRTEELATAKERLEFDIEKRQQAEASNARLAAAIDHVCESILVTDADGTILHVNPAFERISGYCREEAQGKNPRMMNSGKHGPDFYKNLWDTIKKGGTWSGTIINRKKSGALMENEAVISPVTDEKGKIVNFVGVMRDVTNEKEMEHRLQVMQKLEAIGTLAGGVAHDFNNLLTGILGYSNLLKTQAGNDSDVREAAEGIEKASRRAMELTQQLLGFARRGKFKSMPVNVHETIREVVGLLSRTIDKGIRIETVFDANCSTVSGDPVQIQQVILNLAVNARDAMPKGGELWIQTQKVWLDETYCLSHPGAKPGDFLMIAVTDSGVGIPQEEHARIFEPFFTTKEQGKGTGMGLAMVYGIVKNHEGCIRVYSELGKGTTFKVYLPVMDEPVAALQEKPEPPQLRRGTSKILIVDDEDVVRDIASRMLKTLGYTTLTAENGLAAVELYKEKHEEIDLAIVDLNMPKMGGHDCFRAMKEINPNVRAIMSSGYGINGAVQDALDDGMTSFVQKPYIINQLSTAVADALAGQGQEAETKS